MQPALLRYFLCFHAFNPVPSLPACLARPPRKRSLQDCRVGLCLEALARPHIGGEGDEESRQVAEAHVEGRGGKGGLEGGEVKPGM
jgi:hypothetical protein